MNLATQQQVSTWVRQVMEEGYLPHLKDVCSMRNNELCFVSIYGTYNNAPGIKMSMGMSRLVAPASYSSARLVIVEELDEVSIEAVRKVLRLLEAKLKILHEVSKVIWEEVVTS